MAKFDKYFIISGVIIFCSILLFIAFIVYIDSKDKKEYLIECLKHSDIEKCSNNWTSNMGSKK